MNKVAHITDDNPTVAEMRARLARFSALTPTDDYVDAQMPGCERTTLRVIGDPANAPISADDFHLNLIHCEPGRTAPLHSHATPETFMPLSGSWEIFWGPAGDRSLRLEQWDTLVVPPGVSRGFRNVGEGGAWLIGLAGSRTPGAIDWPTTVREAARAAGVNLPPPPTRTTHGHAPAEAPIIDTERLQLRPFEQRDLDAYAHICADPQTMLYMGHGTPLSRLDAWRQMATFEGAWRLLGCGQWAIAKREDGALIGRVGYLDMPGWPDLELGWLVARSEWGQGYAFEAASAVLDHAWHTLRRQDLISLIRPENERSIRLATSLGARLDGCVELFGSEAAVYRHEVSATVAARAPGIDHP